jgi:histidinol phosphatase-like enzyme (inositol monophosphatase family)
MSDAIDWDALTALGHRLAQAAGEAIAPYFRQPLTHATLSKAGEAFDPVTEADRAAERAIRGILAETHPNDAISGEEYGDTPGSSGWTWHLDPIDGTRAFVAGLPLWTTLIGLSDPAGMPQFGIIDQSFLGERYIGRPDGAWLFSRGAMQRLSVRPAARLNEAILMTTDPFIFTPAERGAFDHLRSTARLTRYGCDAYAYARLAAGDVDMVVEAGLKTHDVAALLPVVRGAGGVMSDWRGRDKGAEGRPLSGQLCASASASLRDEAVISLRRSAT